MVISVKPAVSAGAARAQPIDGEFVEASATFHMDRVFARKCLPSANGDINEAWFDFQRKGASDHTLPQPGSWFRSH